MPLLRDLAAVSLVSWAIASWMFVSSIPVGAQEPDPQMCRPEGIPGIVTAGFPLPSTAVTSIGTIRVAVLFVDFSDAVANHSTEHEADLGLPGVEEYFRRASYGKLHLEFGVLHRWIRVGDSYGQYLDENPFDSVVPEKNIVDEAVQLADDDFDFTGYQYVMVVAPSSHFWSGIAFGETQTDEGPIIRSAAINTRRLQEEGVPFNWSINAAHELAHGLGLLDMYPYDRSRHLLTESPQGRQRITVNFGIMGLASYFVAEEQDPRLAFTWRWPDGGTSTDYVNPLLADEMLAWSRWQLGWLEPSQVLCLTGHHATVTLTPVAEPGNGTAMVARPVSESEIIVVESRKKIGYDEGRDYVAPDGRSTTFPTLATEGVLVYKVDARLGTGELPVKVVGDSGDGLVDDYPILASGESVTVYGYTITVGTGTPHTTITITQNFIPPGVGFT